jgi:hypothetical protein
MYMKDLNSIPFVRRSISRILRRDTGVAGFPLALPDHDLHLWWRH